MFLIEAAFVKKLSCIPEAYLATNDKLSGAAMGADVKPRPFPASA